MAIRATTDIKRRSYRVLTRTPAVDWDTVPADLTAWTTFLATFTELGYARKDSLSFPVEKQDVEVLDDNNELTLSFQMEGEFILLQTGSTELTEFDALSGSNQDVMLYAEAQARVVVFGDIVLDLFPKWGGDDTDLYTGNIVKRNAGSQAEIYVHYDQPLV